MNQPVRDRILALAATGLSVEAIQGALARRPVVETAIAETEARPTAALEGEVIAIIQRLIAAIRPNMTLAQIQATPLPGILAAVNGALRTMDAAARMALMEDVVRLQVFYNALAAAGADWRSPEFGTPSRSVSRIVRTEQPSFIEAQSAEIPTLHEIRREVADGGFAV